MKQEKAYRKSCLKLIPMIYLAFALHSLQIEALPTNAEIQGLLALKGGIISDSYQKLKNWSITNTRNVCLDWYGIRCDANNTHVVNLELPFSGRQSELVGTITEDISKLAFLEVLDLSYNILSGKIPSSFGQLSRLTSVDLSGTSFEQDVSSILQLLRQATELDSLSLGYMRQKGGEIPSSIGSYPRLKTLVLSGNDLSGKIPSSIGNLSGLQVLDLSSNHLEGEIPYTFHQLSSLQKLHLFRNNFSGVFPSSVWENNSLQDLELDDNRVLQVNLALLHFENLTYLDASRTQAIHVTEMPSLPVVEELWLRFTGIQSVPASIVNCSRLTYLSLTNNQLRGTVPISLFHLPQLTTLDLSENKLTMIPRESFGNNTVLSTLYLNGNSFHTQVLDTLLRNLRGLESLDLSSNRLSRIPSSDLGNSSIIALDLSNNMLEGQVPDALVQLEKLVSLSLNGNRFSALPQCLGRASGFTFSASDNILSGELPSNPCFYANLTYLDLARNNLRGELPYALGTAVDMTKLHLQNNNLSGGFPTSMANLTALEIFRANDNMLNGDLDKVDFSRLNSLSRLSLHFNSLTGRFPSTLNCTYLNWINLENNHISGSLPKLSKFFTLAVLDLAYNDFTGTLPEELWNVSSVLHVLKISNNRFSGDLSTVDFNRFPAFKVTAESLETHQQFGDVFSTRLESESDELPLLVKGKALADKSLLSTFFLLDLSSNRFTGLLPPSIGSFNLLRYLNIARNNFSGSIPVPLGNLTGLEVLDLSSNEFTGTIPSSFSASFKNISTFNVSFNRLQGPVPTGGQFNTFNGSSYQGNPDLCGGAFLKKCSAQSSSSVRT